MPSFTPNEKSHWFEVDLRVASAMKETVISRLFDWGAQGVAEDDEGDESVIRAYFTDDKRDVIEDELEPFLESVATFFPGQGATQVQWTDVEDENWAETHRRFYPAQKLTRLFFLQPAWETTTAVPDGMLPLILEPGQAFGTGLHASTRLCVRLLEYFVELHPKPDAISALDVGTGTGILAMVLSKLGVHQVTAIDNDPIAIEAAIKNIESNQCSNVALSDSPLGEIEGEFEILVSNILLETHKELSAHYRRLIAPKGSLILSGLLAHQKSEIEEIMSQHGFVLEATESSQDWIALAFTLRSDLHSS